MLATDPFTGITETRIQIQDRVKPELKNIYIALSRAVEEGDQLKIGIVLGQTLTKLEQIINGN
jgi:hypothetical protein